MDKKFYFFVMFSCLQVALSAKEFCLSKMEVVALTCPESHVLNVTSATLGFWSSSTKCLNQKPFYDDCYIDASRLLGSMCSGNTTCTPNITGLLSHAHQRCSDFLPTMLNETHQCVPVSGQCTSDRLMIINATAYPTGYLASSYMLSARGGVATCSWRLDAQSGMHLRLTVLDYAVSRQVAPGSYDCLTYVDVDDDGPPYDSRKEVLCTGNTTAIRTASSKSYQVTVRMSHSGRPNDAHYLVKYEVVGCAWPPVPSGAQIKSLNENKTTIVISCLHGPGTWLLQCNGSEWSGEHGSCPSEPTSKPELKPDDKSASGLTYSMSILIIACIAVVLCLVILLVGFIFIKRSVHFKESDYMMHYKQCMAPDYSGVPGMAPDLLHSHDVSGRHLPLHPCDSQRPLLQRQNTVMSTTSGDEYAHIWDVHRHPIPVQSPTIPPTSPLPPSSPSANDVDLGCCRGGIDPATGTMMSTAFLPHRPRADRLYHPYHEVAMHQRRLPSIPGEWPYYWELEANAAAVAAANGQATPMPVACPMPVYPPEGARFVPISADRWRLASVRSPSCTCSRVAAMPLDPMGTTRSQKVTSKKKRGQPLRRLHSFTEVEMYRKDSSSGSDEVFETLRKKK